MRSISWLAFVLVVSRAAFAGDVNPKAITVWEKLPEDVRVVQTAPTYEALEKDVRPTLTVSYGNFDTLLVTAGKEKDESRYFTIATARCLAQKNRPMRWVIVASGDLALPERTVPVTKIAVTDWKRSEKQIVRTTWARLVSRHNELGTVYEIAFFVEPGGCGSVEQRLLVMHDPANGWRQVGLFSGDVADDVDVTTADTQVGFAATSKNKVNVTMKYATTERPESTSFPRTWRREEFFCGELPLVVPWMTEEWVDIRAGETLSGLVKRLADCTPGMEAKGTRRAFEKALLANILKRNEMTEASVLREGRSLKLPPGEERVKMAAAASAMLGEKLLAEAQMAVGNVKETVYQHKTEIDAGKGIYKADCSGFVGWLMKRAAPEHFKVVPKQEGKSRPLAEDFVAAITGPAKGFRQIEKLAYARPGDLLAWQVPHEEGEVTGHVAIIVSLDKRENGQIAVKIIDATAFPHIGDTRKEGTTGVGMGTIVVEVDVAGRGVGYLNREGQSRLKRVAMVVGRLE